MKFEDVYAKVGAAPCTGQAQCRVLYDWIRESKPADCLELGFLHGKTSCVIAAALQENGGGKLTSIDLTAAKDLKDFPNIIGHLEMTGLSSFVTPVFSPVSYTWELKKLIEQQTKGIVCEPRFDFIFLDGSHLWETDVCAFFLGMKLLKPGGWFLFDDYMWTIETSDWWGKDPQMLKMPLDFRHDSQVERLVNLVAAQHPDIENVTLRDNWAWARKKSGPGIGGPGLTVLTKLLVVRWLFDKLCGR